MKIREMLEREKYINDTIDDFSKRVRAAENEIQFLDRDKEIRIPVGTAKKIADCLDWLQEIFTQNINNISVYDVSIKSLPEMR